MCQEYFKNILELHFRDGKAKCLLETTNEPLYIISEKCGFKSYFRLIEVFRKVEGLTPIKYRKWFRKQH